MPLTAIDAVFGLLITGLLWFMLLRNMSKVSTEDARFRYGRMATATLLVAAAVAATYLWATRGLRDHPAEWLPLPIFVAILAMPLVWAHLTVQAGLSMKRPGRQGGFFWRRVDVGDMSETKRALKFSFGDRVAVITTLCAAAVLALDLWSNRGMRGRPDEWLGRAVCIAIMMSPWFATLCAMWAIASSTNRQRRGGPLWRRVDVDESSD